MLENLRDEIDKIDEKLVALLAARFSAAEKIAIEKQKTGKNVFDGDRERKILEKIRRLAREKNFSPAIATRIFENLFHESRRAQEIKRKQL